MVALLFTTLNFEHEEANAQTYQNHAKNQYCCCKDLAAHFSTLS